MKKISIILSAALLAATFALAGCSNVTELNGSEWDTYKAGASGKSLKEANDAAAAEAKQVTINKTTALTVFADGELKDEKVTIEGQFKESFTYKLKAKAASDVNYTITVTCTDSNGGSVTLSGAPSFNATVKKDATTVEFKISDTPKKFKFYGVPEGAKLTLTIS